jgi:hypothetical protein
VTDTQQPEEAFPPITPWPLFVALLPLTILALLHACEPRSEIRPQELSCTK